MPIVIKSSIRTPIYALLLFIRYSFLSSDDSPALNPAIIPWAAASSYPVVPLICPARYRFFNIVD